MYDELIKRLNPKPVFNLTWYKNEDLYSEGEIEDKIIDMIAGNETENYSKAIAEEFGWSTYYHLTHTRKNIVNWYPFKKDSSVLEIGCGMGAITNLLCEKCNDVTAVELSRKRATAALLRCKDKENLEIIVGNLNDIEFGKKFDYITLIGVLEYQGKYTNTDNPYMDFIKEIKKLLKPDGRLLIAIENKYGLKYWCGAREDHTGIPFAGINQYSFTDNGVRTFSKAELDRLIKESGFKNTYFYYPMPDYKLPRVIYSENWLPDSESSQNLRPYYAPDRSTLVADEMSIYKDVIDNNVFEFFANSFLVECSDSEDVGKVSFAVISNERLEKYRVGTRCIGKDKVEKFALNPTLGQEHLMQIKKNTDALKKAGLNVLEHVYENEKIITDYSKDMLLEETLHELYCKKDIDGIYKMCDKLYNQILCSSEHLTSDDNILYELNIASNMHDDKYGPIMKIGYLDMIFRNAFVKDDDWYWFDQEWILGGVPANYILCRAVRLMYMSFPDMERVLPADKILRRYGLTPEILKEYNSLEKMFIELVMDMYHLTESNYFAYGDRKTYMDNINKILTN